MAPAVYTKDFINFPMSVPMTSASISKYSICSPTSFGRPLYHAQPSCLTPVLPRVTDDHPHSVQCDSQRIL